MSDGKLLKEMGKRIHEKRKALNFTQEQIAEKMDVSTQMISNLELGKKAIRPENLVKLCDTLNCSADFLLTGKERNFPLPQPFYAAAALNKEELSLLSDLIAYMRNK